MDIMRLKEVSYIEIDSVSVYGLRLYLIYYWCKGVMVVLFGRHGQKCNYIINIVISKLPNI